ncbi:hypothetical protein [[Phormidium] sp. ETS-05]|uniref:hypothetical protein n=1 Tax=[Phormidium] sp. ETS-05 TaxID=222819 RepID=UPI0018EF085D|nr:hypothetical protein [[Phormidium] sp. ETS-05]
MATTLKQIAHYLNQCRWRYSVDEAHSRILTGVAAECGEPFAVAIELHENGEYIQFYAPRLLSGVADHPHRELIFRTLLSLSWGCKMLRWEYDLIDGEVRAAIEFPLADTGLSEKQFYRCLNGLVELIDKVAMPRLQAVMTTGIDPGEVELGERLLLMLQESAPTGFVDAISQAAARRKNPKVVSI